MDTDNKTYILYSHQVDVLSASIIHVSLLLSPWILLSGTISVYLGVRLCVPVWLINALYFHCPGCSPYFLTFWIQSCVFLTVCQCTTSAYIGMMDLFSPINMDDKCSSARIFYYAVLSSACIFRSTDITKHMFDGCDIIPSYATTLNCAIFLQVRYTVYINFLRGPTWKLNTTF